MVWGLATVVSVPDVVGDTVTQIRFDYALTIVTDRSMLRIQTDFEFADDAVKRVIDPEESGQFANRIVGDHIRLRPAGTDRFKGSCPFHGERFASLIVAPTVRGGRYHCFGCAADGDVFDFVMAIRQLTFEQAVVVLATRAGIDL